MMICESTDGNALTAVRLTNKSISSVATRSFSSRCMSSLSVIMIAPSLERHIKICEHPVFGPCIRKLCISPRRITESHVKELLRDWTSLVDNVATKSESIARAELMVRRCMDRYRDEQVLIQKGGATELLVRTFAALEARRQDVGLFISPKIRRHYGATFLYRDCCEYWSSGSTISHLTPTLRTCLEAIRISKIQFCKLGITLEDTQDRWSTCRERLDLNLKSFSAEDMKHFSMQKVITFELVRPDSYNLVEITTTIISQARNLQILHLAHGDRFSFRSQSERAKNSPVEFKQGNNALQSIKSDKIKVLDFAIMSLSKQFLVDLLHRYSGTLEVLRLSKCALQDGSWTEVLSYVKDSLPLLRMLNIENLYDATRKSSSTPHLTYRVAITPIRRERERKRERERERERERDRQETDIRDTTYA
jgi:hypothetical protein